MMRLAVTSVGIALVTGRVSAEPLDAGYVDTVNAGVHFGLATAPFDEPSPRRLIAKEE